MTPQYITYESGLESKHLHLGSLAHDFRDPFDLDSYQEKAYTDITEPPPHWAKVEDLENFALTLGKDENDHGGLHKYRVVAGNKAVKLDIKDPENYFKKITLNSAPSKKWLQSHLSALTSSPTKPPKVQIWLLTSLILITHATWTLISSPSTYIVGEAAPFDHTVVNQLRRLSSSGEHKLVFGLDKSMEDEEDKDRRIDIESAGKGKVLETGKFPGTRVWAARWVRVDVEAAEGQGEGEVQLLGKAKGRSVHLSVDADDEESWARNESESVEGDDGFWEGFGDRVEEFMGSVLGVSV